MSMQCKLCPTGKKEITEEGIDVDPRGKNHVHIIQVNKKRKVVWDNCYLDRFVPFSKFEDFTWDFVDLVDAFQKNTKPDLQSVCIRINPRILEEITPLALKRGMNLSQYIENLLKKDIDFIKKLKKAFKY